MLIDLSESERLSIEAALVNIQRGGLSVNQKKQCNGSGEAIDNDSSSSHRLEKAAGKGKRRYCLTR